MENLSKENFWDELMKEYPEAVDHFCKWIDEYKKEVNWNKLFNDSYLQTNIKWATNGEICSIDFSAPKFHDLPFDMQNGIIARYELELFNNAAGHGKDAYDSLAQAYRLNIKKIFIDLQSQINKRKKILN